MFKNKKIKELFFNIKNTVRDNFKQYKDIFKKTYNKQIVYMYLFDAIIVTLIIEMLARHSFAKGIYYLISSPYVLLCNAMIVLMTLSVTLLIRRRIFGMAVISIIWIIFGVANSVLLSYRVTPFTAVDLMLIDSAISIMNKYVSPPMIVLIIVLAIGAVVGLVYIWKKIPKIDHKINIVKTAGIIALVYAIALGSINLGISADLLATKFGNLADSYREFGFVYCFVNSLINTGIDKPQDYSDEKIKSIKDETKEHTKEEEIKKTPNLIFLQLESFFDVNNMKNLKFSENPLPYYTELKEKFPHGYMDVPIVGAGTVNTEFEVMTGMNLDDFGPGEYPFKTVLKEKTCESICYNLKNYGYKCHAIHNNTATFYSRNLVFSNLGYDTFTSVETMNVEERTPMGWAKDKYLTQYIMQALKSSKKQQDYIYTISVQGHGSYPSHEGDFPIKVEGIDDVARKNSFEYYVSQINEMDAFLKELTGELSTLKEDTVLVLYGDHLPSLGITEEELVDGDVFKEEYIIWSNFDAGFENEDIEAFQMQSKILSQFNMDAGDINKYTQKHRLDEDQDEYLEGLKNLEYDMLYGDNLIYEGENPYKGTDIQFGLKKVIFRSINPTLAEDGKIYIYGSNFTQYSRVFVNDKKLETEFVDPSTLIVYYPELEIGDSFLVKQQNSDSHVLIVTDSIVYEDENNEEDSDDKMHEETSAVEESSGETEEVTKKHKKKKE
ncbi:MAG: sulfatase-like hydrolase/transferase [Lachnospiraceae bacterium]|nr:sulfatase-like hydrolase/transferase [Lachnospiraceae bacterium]